MLATFDNYPRYEGLAGAGSARSVPSALRVSAGCASSSSTGTSRARNAAMIAASMAGCSPSCGGDGLSCTANDSLASISSDCLTSRSAATTDRVSTLAPGLDMSASKRSLSATARSYTSPAWPSKTSELSASSVTGPASAWARAAAVRRDSGTCFAQCRSIALCSRPYRRATRRRGVPASNAACIAVRSGWAQTWHRAGMLPVCLTSPRCIAALRGVCLAGGVHARTTRIFFGDFHQNRWCYLGTR